MLKITGQLKKEISGYLVVGVVGAVIDFTVFYLSLFFGLPPILSQWLGATSGLLHNHLWHHFWLFDHNRNLGFTTPLSFGVAVLAVIISGPLLELLTSFIPSVFLSKTLMVGLIAVILFLIRKKWIFTKD